jgi:TolB protein
MGVYMRNPRGVDVIQVTQTQDSGPVWAPTGPLIAYFSEITVIDNEGKEKVDTEMRIVDAETMEVTSLVAQVHAESGISWSPDGKKITYVADVNGNKEVFVMEEDGSNQIQLTRNHLDDIFPVWSRDGNKIVFVSQLHGNAEIIVMDVDGKKQRRLTNNRAKDVSPNW